MPTNEAALNALARQLAARDERERVARLERSRGERLAAAGPEPEPIQPSPRGTFPVMQGEVAPSRPATMMVPSRSTYDMMSEDEKRRSADDAWMRGMGASALAGAALAGPVLGPGVTIGEGVMGGLSGGVAGGAAPFSLVGMAVDRMAGRMNPTSPTAGRFTPGPRVQEELKRSYYPEQPMTRRMGISGEAVSPAAIEAAGERVAIRRAQERAAEDAAIEARAQEIRDYRRQLARAAMQQEAAEAARQRRLTEIFGSPTQRAEDILALEASRMMRR